MVGALGANNEILIVSEQLLLSVTVTKYVALPREANVFEVWFAPPILY